jgi:hypothetical protein
MKKSEYFLIAITLILFNLIIFSTLYASEKRLAYPATVNYSDFIVYFPYEIEHKSISGKGYTADRFSSKYSDTYSSFRAEFYRLSDRNTFIHSLKQTCLNYVKISGFDIGNVAITDSSLGKKATFDGYKKYQDNLLRLHGIIYVGNKSAVMCLIFEPANIFPTEDAVFFIDKIGTKK